MIIYMASAAGSISIHGSHDLHLPEIRFGLPDPTMATTDSVETSECLIRFYLAISHVLTAEQVVHCLA